MLADFNHCIGGFNGADQPFVSTSPSALFILPFPVIKHEIPARDPFDQPCRVITGVALA